MGKIDPSDYQRAKALLIEALALSRLERRGFLDEHCRDNARLRDEVESLLRYEDESRREGFLEQSLGSVVEPLMSSSLNGGAIEGGAGEGGAGQAGAEMSETSSQAPSDRPAITRRPALGRFGNYDLLQEVAQGGMGIVYKARQHKPDRIVAVKLLRAGELASRKAVQRFQTEAQAAASLRHPNIVSIHEVGEIDGRHFFSMDYVDGQSLAELIQNEAMSGVAAAHCVKTVAEAIQFAHSQGILHRDLKPSNVLIDVTGHVHVTDFGLAKRIDQDADLTESGEILGTPSYMSPEQALGQIARLGPTSDVFSLGALLYTLLTGRAPFRAETPVATIFQVTGSEPVSPRLLNPKLSPDLETICLKSLEKSPEKRYASAQGLADDLGQFLEGNPIEARPVSRMERGLRWWRRNRVSAGLAAALCLTLLTALIAVGSLNRSLKQRSQEVLDQRLKAQETSIVAGRQRGIADRERLRARRLAYAADIRRAHTAYQAGKRDEASDSLAGHRPRTESEDLRGWEWFYVKSLLETGPSPLGEQSPEASSADVRRSPEGKLMAIDASINTIGFSPTGNYLATGDKDGSAIIWRVPAGERHKMLTGHEGAVSALAWNREGTLLATGGVDGLVCLWDVASGERRDAFHGNGSSITSLAWDRTRNWILTAATDKSMRIWNPEVGDQPNTPPPLPEPIKALAVPSDGRYLLLAAETLPVRLWSPDSRKVLSELAADSHQSTAPVAISPDGTHVATMGKGILIWNAEDSDLVNSIAAHGIACITWSPDGRRIATGDDDGLLRIWDPRLGQELLALSANVGTINAIDWHPVGNVIVTASSSEGVMKVWDTSLGYRLEELGQ